MTAFEVAGIVITLLFAVAFKVFEKTWLPPAALFVAGFVSATYFYVNIVVRSTVFRSAFAPHNTDAALSLATKSFAALLLGYIIFFLVRKAGRNRPLNTRIHPRAFRLLAGALAVVLAWNVISHPLLAGTELQRGEGAYLFDSDIGWSYRLRFISSQLQLPLTAAVYVAALQWRGRLAYKGRVLAFFGVTVVVLSTLLSFDRHAAVSMIVVFALISHYRVKRLGTRVLLLIGLLLVTAQALRSLRVLSYANVSIADAGVIFQYLNWKAVVLGPLAAIGGWDVFANVLDLVPSTHPLAFGATYAHSVAGLLRPRVLGLASFEEMTPSRWYMEAYAPGTSNHGFDFSMLAEAYMNFGNCMPFAFLFVGIYVAWLSKVIRTTSSPYWLLFGVMALESLTFGLRMDSNAVLKGTVLRTLPVVFVLWVGSRLVITPNLGKSHSNEVRPVTPASIGE